MLKIEKKSLLENENVFFNGRIKNESDINKLDCYDKEKELLREELEGITTIEYLEDDMIKCNPDFE